MASLSVARFVASERALTILRDATSEKALSRLCVCGRAIDVDTAGDVGEAAPQEENPVTAKEGSVDNLSESKDLEEVAAILTQADLAEGVDWSTW